MTRPHLGLLLLLAACILTDVLACGAGGELARVTLLKWSGSSSPPAVPFYVLELLRRWSIWFGLLLCAATFYVAGRRLRGILEEPRAMMLLISLALYGVALFALAALMSAACFA